VKKKVYGYTSAGEPIDDKMIEQFVEEADEGYDENKFRERPRGRGRPPLGDAAKVVGSLRLDPDLRLEAELQADKEGISVSELFRKSLRKYLGELQPSENFRQSFMDELQAYRQKLNEVDVTKRLTAIDNWLASEINKSFTSLMSDSSKRLSQFSGGLRELNADLKTMVESELATVRRVTGKTVEKVQANSTFQISQVREIIAEVEKALSNLEDMFHSQSGKPR
jgi:hypothetical protein